VAFCWYLQGHKKSLLWVGEGWSLCRRNVSSRTFGVLNPCELIPWEINLIDPHKSNCICKECYELRRIKHRLNRQNVQINITHFLPIKIPAKKGQYNHYTAVFHLPKSDWSLYILIERLFLP